MRSSRFRPIQSRAICALDRDAFLGDEKTGDAVVRNLEVIGEAASRLPGRFRERSAAVPRGRIVGLRNRVVHATFDVDLELVWEIVRIELPELNVRLRVLLAEAGADGDQGGT